MELGRPEEHYQLLDLSYIREIGQGDIAYERNVAELFLDIIPENLSNLERDIEDEAYGNVKKTLHHMQSSISIMGFYPKLEQYMEPTVYDDISAEQIHQNVEMILAICREALAEARHYLNSLN